MIKILIISLMLIFNFSISVFAEDKKCGALDFGCKTKRFIENTKNFQKKGFEKSKDQVGSTAKKILKGKDVLVEDVKGTAEGITDAAGTLKDNVKKEIKK